MTKLTEDMIIARTKCSELGAVKKLNCWGSDLVDVCLVKRLSNVEVLSLSLNKITTLSDFQCCRNLVELYIRRNAIRDLSELCYLQDLPRLRRLLLAENPCVETAGPAYRATVLRCLPHLEVLDNNEVTTDEVEQAMRVGLILEHPLARRERVTPEPNYYREESPPMMPVSSRRASNAVDYDEAFRNSSGLSRSPPSEYSPYIQQHEDKERRSPEESPAAPISNGNNNGLRHRRHSLQSSGSLIEDHGPSPPTNAVSSTNNNTNNLPSEIPVVRKVQRSPVQEYYTPPAQHRDGVERERPEMTNGGSYQQRKGSTDYVQETMRMYQDGYYDESPPLQQRNSGSIQTQGNRYVQNIRPKPRTKPQANDPRYGEQNSAGPRSSNLLSAVLCLIPELDWASLEVVELAVRRRMDELVSD